MSLLARVAGIGVAGPGLPDWESARAALRDPAAFVRSPTAVPVPEALPPVERRRCGTNVKLALGAGFEAARRSGLPPEAFATVFASSSGDGDNCHAICETLASEDRQISPTRFHNSVHNAPSGYWSIASRSTRPSDSIGAFDASFAAGLLEALTRIAGGESPVMLIAYDSPYPEPLQAARPMTDGFAVALALLPPDATGLLLGATIANEAPTVLANEALEALRLGVPAARSLALLALLARGDTGTAALEYLPGLALRIEVSP
ncbi:MAG: beta-ketoacyl synthase chain length factor [Betaproteobacteria bacterium]|nr:beta-ketoacyl synthase chain length factor [Betaproteobacteria bacterium]